MFCLLEGEVEDRGLYLFTIPYEGDTMDDQGDGQKFPVRRKGGRVGLLPRVSGRHVVRGRQSLP